MLVRFKHRSFRWNFFLPFYENNNNTWMFRFFVSLLLLSFCIQARKHFLCEWHAVLLFLFVCLMRSAKCWLLLKSPIFSSASNKVTRIWSPFRSHQNNVFSCLSLFLLCPVVHASMLCLYMTLISETYQN